MAFSVVSSSRFVNQPIGKFKPFSASSILPSIIIPQVHRRNCTAVSIPSTSEGQQLVRSPQLIALEYADLNLSDSFSETTFGAVLAKETLLTGEEAITHAMAAEAVALAKAAANVSEDSKMMFGHYSSSKLDGRPAIIPSEPDTTQLAEIGLVGVEVGSTLAKNGLGENCYPSKEADLERTLVAVRSRSQTKRKGRREKVAQKAAAKDTCVKSVFTIPKRRATLLQGDYYNPLGVLDGVTRRSRVLTRAEEHNLSEGVKVDDSIDALASATILAPARRTRDFGGEWQISAVGSEGIEELLVFMAIYGEYAPLILYGFDLVEMNLPKDTRNEFGVVLLQDLHSTDLLKIEKLMEELDDGATFAEWAAAAGIDEKTLSRRLAHGTRCKDKIIRSFLWLVGSIAKIYHRPGRNLGELIWAGCQGIIRTTKKFDPRKGRFSTYATWWIKFEIRKSVRDQSSSSRLPEEEDPLDDCSPEEAVRRRDLKRELEKELDKLTPKEKQVVKGRFGMDNEGSMTLQAIGDIMDLTRERHIVNVNERRGFSYGGGIINILGDVPFGMTVPVLLQDGSDRSEPNATLVADLGL
ncbi:hypothetical protein RHSIM_Rhsim05G0005800 [Rhododendron simsii]|uniref:Sigma factor n=1 Tax=Rhododendron simsii TaxID=118357 RepID=A0A834H9K6_RHOSS|nr:hypothetical protein RHSIM_Rhsim05G0005800 [Rhododendron simsii]